LQIIVMRHTHAISRESCAVPYDAERALSDTGREQARHVGNILRHVDLVPDPIVSSPFLRAQETAALVCEQFPEVTRPLPLTILAPGSGTDELLRAAINYGETDSRWMLAVMHEPDVGYILGNLLFEGRACPFPVLPGDVFALDITVSRGQIRALLALYISPTMIVASDMSESVEME